jgi:hypothetical protein
MPDSKTDMAFETKYYHRVGTGENVTIFMPIEYVNGVRQLNTFEWYVTTGHVLR